MAMHLLKTWPEPFQALWDKRKTFEVRRDDRGYQVGDLLMLREYLPLANHLTGRYVRAVVNYKLTHADGDFGLRDGFCVLGIDTMNNFFEEAHPLPGA